MEKIQMKTPLVEMDGDEMTRVLWRMIKDELICPFVDLKTEYYDLGLLHRNETQDQVTVDAATGRVLDYEKENLRGGTGSTDIGAQAAKAATLKHAGLSESQVWELQAEWDNENGRAVYEVEFKSGGMEYEYVIDAATGAVLDHEVERDD